LVFRIALDVFVHKRRDQMHISAQTMYKRLAWSELQILEIRGGHWNGP